ncbi:AT-hook motif nuclear-localized protein 10 [Capsicum annuum]|uniref:AT-hook motif nuclear-localized protein n=1 Tax=Capsicum annuum TaxID=4072 RepID=A0A2G2YAA5_CAPAN|nr:AT-hook motif nuclear-localized protein 10 [Capsicum annuum]
MLEVLKDVAYKIMLFSQNAPKAVCILSATGAITNVTLRQTFGVTVTYEGRFDIVSLPGSFVPSQIGSQQSKKGGFSVSLARSDGRIFGGGVAGVLTAASPVQMRKARFRWFGHVVRRDLDAPVKRFERLDIVGLRSIGEGNFNLVGNNVPVFFNRDAKSFPDTIRA